MVEGEATAEAAVAADGRKRMTGPSWMKTWVIDAGLAET